MIPGQILPSTTSHKQEGLVPVLDLFAHLGFRDLDLNLNHFVERGTDVDEVRAALAANGQRVWIVSGGWCDFFDGEPAIQQTVESVERQVGLARTFGVDRLRLFFGRLPHERWTRAALATITANVTRLADRHPDLLFVFENHNGASSHPDVCRSIIEGVDRQNVRLTFDPINFEHRGVRTMDALRLLQPFVAHVHLKGYAEGGFCGFGEGDVDLVPALEALIGGGYDGAFTVEYEGSGDRTLRLYQSVQRARAVLERLLGRGA